MLKKSCSSKTAGT